MTGLELVDYNPDPVKSAVMSRAAELRSEGYDASDALFQAWDELDDGDDDEEEDWDLDIIPQSKRRRSNTMENPIGGGSLLLVVGGLYLTWCAVKYFKTKVWSWQPWRTPAPTSRQLTTRVPRPVTAIEQSNSHNTLYRAKDFTEETIQIIVP